MVVGWYQRVGSSSGFGGSGRGMVAVVVVAVVVAAVVVLVVGLTVVASVVAVVAAVEGVQVGPLLVQTQMGFFEIWFFGRF